MACLVLAWAAGAATARDAPAAPQRLVFEAASVKPSDPYATPQHMRVWDRENAHTRVDISANLVAIIQNAYGLDRYQMDNIELAEAVGNFDIVAIPPMMPATSDQMRTMLQDLLTDRFRLEVKIETRAMPGYALMVAKGGLKMQPIAEPSPGFVGDDGLPRLGAIQMTMADFVLNIRPGADGYNAGGQNQYIPVEDRTGLTGLYNFIAVLGDNYLSPANAPGKYHPDGIEPETLSDLLSDRLGLTLVKTTLNRPFLTIVHVEKPTPN